MGKRIISLDVLRGLTVAGMIVVNNAGGELSYAQLQHSVWNGLTICDLVFPFFLFMVGMSIYIALSKFEFRCEGPVVTKILKRTLLILLIGWGLDWLHHLLKGDFFPVEHLRLMGVLPRIALCYGMVALLSVSLRHRNFVWLIIVLLGIYSAILITGNGYSCSTDNVLVQIDRMLFGEAHLYTKSPVDPEGFVSTLPAIAHTMIGFLAGRWMTSRTELSYKIQRMLVAGFVLATVGLILSLVLPVNKRVWSPSFVFVTCGIALMLLSVITYITDTKQLTRFSWMIYYGANPLALYVGSEIIAMMLSTYHIKTYIYNLISIPISNPYLASAIYAFAFSALFGCLGYMLYQRKIFIKL